MTGQPNATEEAITVGIDVAKHTIEVALGADGPILSLANDAAGFEALLEHLAAHRVALVVVAPAVWSRRWPVRCSWPPMRWPSSTPGRHATSRGR